MEFLGTNILFNQLKIELCLDVVDIKLVIKPDNLCYNEENLKFNGLCECNNLNPPEITYTVTLNENLDEKSFLFYNVLAHEMRHVQQFHLYQLDITSDKTFYWESKRFYFSNIKYENYPHEIDANKYATKWALQNHPKYKNKNWNIEKILTVLDTQKQ